MYDLDVPRPTRLLLRCPPRRPQNGLCDQADPLALSVRIADAADGATPLLPRRVVGGP